MNEEERVRPCPMCGRTVNNPNWRYCTIKCRDQAALEQERIVNRDLKQLMEDWNRQNWTSVDGWQNE